ncbi:CPBP family intramembrane glutamic endopeptidase [Clostridium manihotivorum]|uniref:CAAX prenyl protease 2/Lysostaphin resistance protein A-like domain-containing protein n=1 Tax=Clostridium manihotivorum TaxID=2320868 RepID=A0A410DUA2_9CLOT|nr:CPBP family intramembrane glutamic endopeptidase [Clostridium manihotivorum]QAA32578.1 hypothetical protein C1I91_13555 [Clostridium manihotivorum]
MDNKMKVKKLSLDFGVLIIAAIVYFTYFAVAKHKVELWMILKALIEFLTAFICVAIIEFISIRENRSIEIFSSKTAIIPFCIIFSLNIFSAIILDRFFGLNNSTTGKSNFTIVFLFQLVITSYILISYLFKIKLSSFKWNISKKTFLYIILLFLIINISDLINSLLLNGKIITATGHNYIVWLFISTSFHIFYPALCEEVLWRGILISALRGMRIKNEYCNIIQAVLFGLAHTFMIGTNISFIFVLHTAVQMIWGYVFGKLYFKTKSLVPGMIFHALFNTRYFIV